MTDRRREVEELRGEIGKIDVQVLAALEKRGKLARRIGELRKSMAAPPVLPDTRQIDEIIGKSQGDIPQAALREIFREIFATCLSLEQPVVISYFGLDGGFAH